MLISQIQLDRKKEELIQRSLKNGVIPTSYEVGSRAAEFFNSRTSGLPYYRPVKQTPYGTSNPTTYNQMFSNLKEDLEIAYLANIHNSHQNTELEENYLIEKDKTQSKIEALQLRLKALDEAIRQTDTVYNHSKTFEHFYDIELDGDLERNLPRTSCYIDLNQKSVYLDRMSSSIDRCDLSEATLSIQAIGDFTNIKTLGEPRNILKDSINESCTVIVYSKTNQSLSLAVDVEIPEALTCNSVQLKMFSQRSSQAALRLQKADQTEELLYSISHHDHYEWSFDSDSITKLNLTIVKDEADGVNEDGLYEYVFTLKNLSASCESFSGKGIFVSKPITLNHAVGSVELQVDEMVFDDTDISYFIGIDNGSNQINWERVTPGLATELGIVEDVEVFIETNNKSNIEMTEKTGKEKGQFREIFTIPEDCLVNTLKITPALDGWHMACYDYYEYSDGNPTRNPIDLNTLDINELQKLPGIAYYQDFVGATQRDIYTYSNAVVILTQYVEMEEERYVQEGSFTLDGGVKLHSTENSIDELQVRVFVNGVEVQLIEKQLSFKLRKGRNKVQIMFVKDEVGNDFDNIKIYNSLDLTTIAKNVYGLDTLKQINYQTMMDKISKYLELADSYYTIVNNRVYTLYDLRDELYPEDNITPYKVNYQRIKPSCKKLLTRQNNQHQMTIRLMAVFKSQNKSYSPKLMSYRIVAK